MLKLSIDRRKTKNIVEDNLKRFNYYLLSIADDDQLIIDNNTFEIKLDIIEEAMSGRKKEKLKVVQQVITCFNRLCILDRKIIYFTYMIKEKKNDDFIANELGFNLNYYYRIKKRAIMSMAYALDIEVYEGDNNENDR